MPKPKNKLLVPVADEYPTTIDVCFTCEEIEAFIENETDTAWRGRKWMKSAPTRLAVRTEVLLETRAWLRSQASREASYEIQGHSNTSRLVLFTSLYPTL